MSRISLTELKSTKPQVDVLRLLSLEPAIYIVEVDIGGDTLRVVDDQGHALTYRCQLDAKKPFKGLGIEQTRLRHESPYDEMIGLPGKAETGMEVRIQNPDDDYT